MVKWRWAWVAVLLAVGALLFGACDGGDDDDDGGADEPRATEPAGEDEPEEEEEEQQEEEEEGEGEEEEEPSGEGGDRDEFVAATRSFIDSTFKAEYDANFPAAQGAPTTFTMYKSGTDKFRFDATTEAGGMTLEFFFINAGDTTGFCLSDAGPLAPVLGVEAGQGVCSTQDPTQGSLDTLSDLLSEFEDEDLDSVETLPSREIAGETAHCGRESGVDGTTEACITSDGVLAYILADDGTELTATSISDDVSDSDFELPYEIVEFPGLE
jgi:hypothetical protein